MMEPLSLIFKVLWSPGEGMQRVSKNPRFLAPLLILSFISVVTATVAFLYIDPGTIAIRQVQQQLGDQQLSDEMREQILSNARNPVLRSVGFVFSAVGVVIQVGFVALVYFGLFTLFGREAGFKAFFAVTSFAFIPMIFRHLTVSVMAISLPESAIIPQELGAISPVLFLDPNAVSRPVYVAASLIDVVSIWILILLAIGFRFLIGRKVSTLTRYVAVFVPWLVYAGFRMALAFAFNF